jgi:4-hydroxybenzoyl-CoA reductase subunit beta
MLRMPEFQFHMARDAAHAVSLYAQLGDAMYVAGGTDLLPNIKHKLFTPAHVIGLNRLPSGIREEDGQLVLDGQATLDELANSALVQRWAPPLAAAAGLVAGPQLRRMGTIGGNILLDTRCLFYNQTAFWRQALGHCLKAEGDWCHVIGSKKTCVATQSSDTVPVLLAMDASIELLSAEGARVLNLRDLYRFNGMDHLKLNEGELLTRVFVPVAPAGFRGSYRKLRTRDSIDFPQLSLAICGVWDGDICTKLDIVVGAVGPVPKPVKKLEHFTGAPLTEEAIGFIAQGVVKAARPNTSVHGEVAWRRAMSGIFATRMLADLQG